MEHTLKTWPEQFQAIHDERKTFEIRKNDRKFAVGDRLVLREYCPTCDSYSGRVKNRRVTHIMTGPAFGLPDGYCIMSIYPFMTGPVTKDDKLRDWQRDVIENLRSFEPMEGEEVDLPTIELAIRHLKAMWEDAETDRKDCHDV